MQRSSSSQPIQASLFTTISPQMYSTIDYVDIKQQRSRSGIIANYNNANNQLPQQWAQTSQPLNQFPIQSQDNYLHYANNNNNNNLPPPYDTNMRLNSWQRRAQTQLISSPQIQPFNRQGSIATTTTTSQAANNGIKLVCDIDQVFPIPEVNMYSLAKADGSHPEKLAILDTRIERNPQNGLFHVQVISILEVDEILRKYGPEMPIYFECLIALTNFELSRYADYKRSAIYWPGQVANSLSRSSQEDLASTSSMFANNGFANNYSQSKMGPTSTVLILYSAIMILVLKVIFNSNQRQQQHLLGMF